MTHDIAETLSFERVIVVHGGRVIEDGRPKELAGLSGSRYAAMLASALADAGSIAPVPASPAAAPRLAYLSDFPWTKLD